MNAIVEQQIKNTVEGTLGPKAMQALRGIGKLAARQGGESTLENYQLLGKRALVVGGIAVAVVQTGILIGGIALTRRSEKHRIEKTVRKILAEERARERNEQGKGCSHGADGGAGEGDDESEGDR